MALVVEKAEDALAKFHSALGPFLVQFQGTEYKVARAIGFLAGTTREMALELTSERTTKDLIGLARRLAPLSKLVDAEQTELAMLLKQFEVLNEFRNALVHRSVVSMGVVRDTRGIEPPIYRFWAASMLYVTKQGIKKKISFTLDALTLATSDLQLISTRLIPLVRKDAPQSPDCPLAGTRWGYSKNMPWPKATAK